jgi:hypothetical protein
MQQNVSSRSDDGNARLRRVVLGLSLAAFAAAGALVGWDYWARLEEERRLAPYFESERILEAAMRRRPPLPKGTGARAPRPGPADTGKE